MLNMRMTTTAVALALALPSAAAAVSVDFVTSFRPTDDVHVFLRATTVHFAASTPEVTSAARLSAWPEDVAVALFVARESGVDVGVIVTRHSQGETWYSLMRSMRVSPDRLYLELPDQYGPPYGKAHGYRGNRRVARRPAILSDEEVRELVALQVTSGFFRLAPVSVVEKRKQAWGFVEVAGDLYRVGAAEPGAPHIVAVSEPPKTMSHATKPPKDAKGKGRGGSH